MKRSVFLLLLVVTGALACSLVVTFHPPPPLLAPARSSASYDTRACVEHPSPSACDGKLASAPWDAGIPAGRDGNEVCLQGVRETLAAVPIVFWKHQIGTMQLLFAHRCQSEYALLSVARPLTSIGVLIAQGATRQASSFTDFGGGEHTEASSPLLFAHTAVTVVATIAFPDGTATTSTLHWSEKSRVK